MLALIDVIGWVIAIAAVAVGVFCLIMTFKESNGWLKFCCVLFTALSVVVFFIVYNWLDSVCVALFVAGGILVLFSNGADKNYIPETKQTSQEGTKKYGLGKAMMDSYCEYELYKAAAKDAMREMKK